jgi:hypothetical protein
LCALAEWYVFTSNGKEDLSDVIEKLKNAKEILLHAYDILKDLEDSSDQPNKEKNKNIGQIGETSQEKFFYLFSIFLTFYYLFIYLYICLLIRYSKNKLKGSVTTALMSVSLASFNNNSSSSNLLFLFTIIFYYYILLLISIKKKASVAEIQKKKTKKLSILDIDSLIRINMMLS